MNGKGGMNNEEFEPYIDNSIVPLFPNLRTCQGSVSCSRLTVVVVEIGGTSSTSVASGVFMLLPIWSQTFFRNGDCPYGIFYGDPHMITGILVW
jgi:hypothetical protein